MYCTKNVLSRQFVGSARRFPRYPSIGGLHIWGRCVPRALSMKIDASNSVTYNPREDGEFEEEEPRMSSFEALEQVKALGMSTLEEDTRDVAENTRKPLFAPDHFLEGPTPAQLSEANRVLKVSIDVLESLVDRGDETFCIKGDPIMFTEAEVSPDRRYARVIWVLPVSILDLPDHIQTPIIQRMQTILEKYGYKITRSVHSRLSFYYPPRIKFVPSPENELKDAIQDGIDDF